jgi:hypothetical protein
LFRTPTDEGGGGSAKSTRAAVRQAMAARDAACHPEAGHMSCRGRPWCSARRTNGDDMAFGTGVEDDGGRVPGAARSASSPGTPRSVCCGGKRDSSPSAVLRNAAPQGWPDGVADMGGQDFEPTMPRFLNAHPHPRSTRLQKRGSRRGVLSGPARAASGAARQFWFCR